MKLVLTVLAVSGLLGCATRPAADPSAEDLKIAKAAYDRGECNVASKHWKLAANRNNAIGQNGVGIYYQIGCAPAGISVDYKAAADWYKKAAQQGLDAAYANLGHLYKSGAGVEKSDQQAIAHYHYAARWGNASAIKALRVAYNMSAPEPDLLIANQRRIAERSAAMAEAERKKAQEDKEFSAAMGAIAGAVLLGVAGYYAGKSGTASPYIAPTALSTTPKPVAQVASSMPGTTTQQTPTNSTQATVASSMSTTSSVSLGCSSDFSCGVGQACVKPMFQSSGVCLTKVDELGIKQYSAPSSNSIGVRTSASCHFNTDCPVGFRCDTTLKACVR